MRADFQQAFTLLARQSGDDALQRKAPCFLAATRKVAFGGRRDFAVKMTFTQSLLGNLLTNRSQTSRRRRRSPATDRPASRRQRVDEGVGDDPAFRRPQRRGRRPNRRLGADRRDAIRHSRKLAARRPRASHVLTAAATAPTSSSTQVGSPDSAHAATSRRRAARPASSNAFWKAFIEEGGCGGARAAEGPPRAAPPSARLP